MFLLQPDGNAINYVISLSASAPFPLKLPSYCQNVKLQICTPYDMTNKCCFLMSFIMNSDIFLALQKFWTALLVALFLSSNNKNNNVHR